MNVDLLNSVVEETTVQISELEQQIAAAETKLRELVSGSGHIKWDYAQLMNWATLYDNCSLLRFYATPFPASNLLQKSH